MTATKEMERKALEKIRKIVAGLGECSYIGMAFEGCFEIAEENIENDFGCSMQQRAEEAEERAKKAEERADYFREVANSMSEKLEEAEEAANRLRREAYERKQRELSGADLSAIDTIIRSRLAEITRELQETADKIVEYATEPESASFKEAVREHRLGLERQEAFNQLTERVEAAMF